ncbi:L-threonylcarbamoyladenylate synthase [Halovenus marina]|uniref:L-threonylcarbamoyladenylate synthase n=1 Tax=Halovenus marina TaxID=3396621 RepID=UPI003F5476BA
MSDDTAHVLDESTESYERAREAIDAGSLVVYPTETVYGLGADAIDPDAVERVFQAKARDRSKPLSMAVSSRTAAETYTNPTERERAFMQRFLPGPVTVVLERNSQVPDALTAGRDRVGVRVPDRDATLALLSHVEPMTATSANVSGAESARRVAELDDQIREAVAIIIDGGETPGGRGSTVVDVERGQIHRRGPKADDIEAWLAEY